MAEEKKPKKLIAIILVRGRIGINTGILDTLDLLGLHKKNYCVIVEATPSILGMIAKVKDYITYGNINESVLKELLDKKTEKNPKELYKSRNAWSLMHKRVKKTRRDF